MYVCVHARACTHTHTHTHTHTVFSCNLNPWLSLGRLHAWTYDPGHSHLHFAGFLVPVTGSITIHDTLEDTHQLWSFPGLAWPRGASTVGTAVRPSARQTPLRWLHAGCGDCPQRCSAGRGQPTASLGWLLMLPTGVS